MKENQWIVGLVVIVVILTLGGLVYFSWNKLNAPFPDDAKTPVSEATSISTVQQTSPEAEETLAIKPSSPQAPDFELVSLSGETISLLDYEGKVVMINFWATYCPPCREEMPLIQEAAQRFSEQLVVLAINAGEDERVVKAFVEETALDLIILMDPENAVSSLYQVRGLPMTFFIDETGLLTAIRVGGMDETVLASYLQLIGLSE